MSTFAQLKENISLELGLDETASGDEDTLVGRRLNQGVRKVLLDTKCRVIGAAANLTGSEGDYEMDTDVLALHNIINSDGVPLVRLSVDEIHELRRGTNPSESNVYRYALDGANLLLIYPTPEDTSALTLYYTPMPTEMSSGSHDPSATTYGGIPVEYHDAIEYYALYRLASYDDDQSSGVGALYKQQYDAEIKSIKKAIRKRGGRTLGPVRIGHPARRRVPRDPSTDIG